MAENQKTSSIADEVGSDNHSNGHVCTNCSTEASFYCQICDVFYCRECLKCIDLCDHGVIGKFYADRWGQMKQEEATEKCRRHPKKEVELYCGNHGVVCCTICVSLDHRHCKTMEYIPEACKSYDKSDDLRKIKNGFKSVKSHVDNLHAEWQSRTATFTNLHHDIMSSIRRYRKEINTILDDLESKSLSEIRKIEEYHNGILKKNLMSCQDIKESLTEYESRFKEFGRSDVDLPFVFVKLKKYCEWLTETLSFLKKDETVKLRKHIQFVCHEKIREILTQFKGLGCITNAQYSVTNVKHIEGITTGQHSRMCQMPNGTIVVINSSYTSLTLLDTAYDVSCNVRCSHDMTGICSIDNSEIVTCSSGVDGDCKIRFLSLGRSSITENFSFQPNKHTACLAYSNRFLFAINYSYNETGKLLYVDEVDRRSRTRDDLRRPMLCSSPRNIVLRDGDKTKYVIHKYSGSGAFHPGSSSSQLFSFQYGKCGGIATSDDGRTIYVAADQGLVIMDDKGNHLNTIACPQQDGKGNGLDRVCTGPGGIVFVSKGNKLYQLTNHGTSKFVELVGCHPNFHSGKDYTDILFDRHNSNILVLAHSSLYVLECTIF